MVDIDDNDLDPFFFGGAAAAARPVNADAVAGQAVALHFPEIKVPAHREEKERQRRERAARAADKAEGDKRVFVKAAKKAQMYSVLIALRRCTDTLPPVWYWPYMNARERDFAQQMVAKFDKYGVVGAKWVTRKQYDYVMDLGKRYLKLPVAK